MIDSYAPGWPGSPGRWTSAAKSGVGTALAGSPIWFTLSHGILNEIYAQRIDEAATRDVGLLVTGPDGMVSEIKRHATQATRCPIAGVPYYLTDSDCAQGHYRLSSEVITDSERPVVLVRVRFTPLRGAPGCYRLYVLLAPHLGNHGGGNTAWVGDYRGRPSLFASREGRALCLMSATGMGARSVGFVGVSDGWQDLMAHGELRWSHTRAENGNVAMIAELPLHEGEAVYAIAVGRGAEEAGHQSRASLVEGYATLLEQYVQRWQQWQAQLVAGMRGALSGVSTTVIKAHESKLIPGALLASLAVPWGFSKGDGDLGGYHRCAARHGAVGRRSAPWRRVRATKHAPRWSIYAPRSTPTDTGRRTWVDGTSYWNGLQMDDGAAHPAR
ncbi:MAG: hypothetical protein U1F35_07940 [Steroidobacteraceae bacterium]